MKLPLYLKPIAAALLMGLACEPNLAADQPLFRPLEAPAATPAIVPTQPTKSAAPQTAPTPGVQAPNPGQAASKGLLGTELLRGQRQEQSQTSPSDIQKAPTSEAKPTSQGASFEEDSSAPTKGRAKAKVGRVTPTVASAKSDKTELPPDPTSEVKFDKEVTIPVKALPQNAQPGVAAPLPGFGGDNTPSGGDVPLKAQPRIPGIIKKMTNEVLEGKAPSYIQAKQGATEIIPISKGKLNRIVTPFDNPEGLTATKGTKVQVQGRSLFVVTNSDEPVELFITDGNGDYAIPTTLIPSDIPPREIFISLAPNAEVPVFGRKFGSGAAQGEEGKDQAFVDTIKNVMRDLALNRLPAGFAIGNLKTERPGAVPRCVQRGFQMQLGQIIDGSDMRIAVYVATNAEGQDLAFDEQSCYRQGVVAVAAWPDVVVAPNKQTEIYVLFRRESDAETQMARPSLIKGQKE